MEGLDAREEIRRFVFEEFVKKDPDEISFKRPDSGSGIYEDEEDSDEESYSGSWLNEEEEMLRDLLNDQGDKKTRTNAKTRHSSRHSDSNRSNKTHKTAKTSKSKKSNRSGRSQNSKKSKIQSRRGSIANSNAKSDSIFDPKNPVALEKLIEAGNPHSEVINRRFLMGFKKNKTYIEALRVSDFKRIDFGNENGGLPVIVRDVFKYLALVDIDTICKEELRKQRMAAKA